MDFVLHDPVLGDLRLDCAHGLVVEEYDFGLPHVREVTEDAALHDGSFDETRYVGPRTVALQVTLDGAKVGVPEPVLRSRLLAYWHPSRRPILRFTEPGHHLGDGDESVTDGRARQIRLRGEAGGIPVAGRHAQIRVSWVGYTGLIESQAEHTVNVTGDVAQAGDAPADWVLEVPGPTPARGAGGTGTTAAGAALPEQVTVSVSVGGVLHELHAVGLALLAGESLVIESARRHAEVRRGAVTVRPASQYLSQWDWPLLPPAKIDGSPNPATFDVREVRAAALVPKAATVTFRDQWMA